VFLRGAKAHQTGAVNSHEILIMPTQALRPEDKDYAIACAVPLNAPGVTMIFGRQTNEERKVEGGMDAGNPEFGLVGGEALVVLEDVLVPWERVFMCGEVEFAGTLVERFASLHRQNYGGCKGGLADVLVGATALAADYQGTSQASHVRDKLAEMTHLAETIYTGSIACSAMGHRTRAGNWEPDTLLANTTKYNVSKNVYEVARLAHDIAGGIIATLPFEDDLKSPEVSRYVQKYLKGVNNVSTEDRIRLLRLIENMTGGTALVESMHGAGSPQAQKVMYLRAGNVEQKKTLAKKLAKISGNE
jgi:4-hydroxybutyryl-CoA dehydratase/vinylacetyl-CoA-Delta-isomerase